MHEILKISIHARLHFMRVSKEGLYSAVYAAINYCVPPFPNVPYKEKFNSLLVYSLY